MTIVAASASTASEGFLGERQPLPMLKIGRLPFWNAESVVSEIEVDMVDGELLRAPEPVHRRAWTLEEWLLSSRRLIYTSGQISWSCARFNDSDSGACSPSLPDILGRPMHSRIRRLTSFEDDIPFNTRLDEVNELWFVIVEEYTRRQLTDSRDKSDAIAGLAQRIEQQTRLQYVCGIWRERLNLGVCWHYQSRIEHASKASDLRRSGLVDCPTWSWASVSFPVHFTRSRSVHVLRSPHREQVGGNLADIWVQEEAVPHELHVFGPAASFRTLDVPVTLTEYDHSLLCTATLKLPESRQSFRIAIFPDTPEIWTVKKRNLRLLFISLERGLDVENRDDWKDKDIAVMGLVVVPTLGATPGRTQYSRIGFFEFSDRGSSLERWLLHRPRDDWFIV